MRIVVDLDGVVASLRLPGQSYSDVEPVPRAVEKLKALKAAGHTIILQTARHMKTCEGNLGLVVARQGKTTLDWLDRWGIEYDEIYFGKPHGDIYLDDNAMRFTGWETIDGDGSTLPRSTERDAGMQVVMTMAGHGKRMADISDDLKPLINVADRPMYLWALQTLATIPYSHLYLIVLDEHRAKFEHQLQRFADLPVTFIYQKTEPNGQLCSVLEARNYFDSDLPILVLGADTLVQTRLASVAQNRRELDGIISVATVPPGDDRWSFAAVDENGLVHRVREKERISDLGCTGAYYFRRADRFLQVADAAIAANESVKGEFYVCPIYQRLIDEGCRIGVSHDRMYDMGTPAAYFAFIEDHPPAIDMIAMLEENAR